MKVLVTGAAGFIGMHVARLLLERGDEVVGIDNLNDYYDPNLKLARLEQLKPFPNFKFVQGDIADRVNMEDLFAAEKPKRVRKPSAKALATASAILTEEPSDVDEPIPPPVKTVRKPRAAKKVADSNAATSE